MSDVVITIVGQDNASSALRNVQRAVASLGDGVAQATQRASALGSVLQGVAQGVGFALANVAAGGVAALGSSLANSVNAAGAFEAALLKFRAVAGDALTATGASLKDVEQLALQLGSSTSYSAQQALDALTELVKGGVSVEDAMGGATEATLNLASAAQLDLSNAAEIVAKQLGVWGSTGVTAANVADLLASAANASTVDVEELALGLANVGGSAKVAGLSFEETVQALALAAPYFSSAADAGTSFKTFLANLSPSTKDATKTMIELGLATADGVSKFFDAQGQFIGMEAAARLLADATRNLSNEQKLQALQTIFGADAIRFAAAMAEAGAAGYAAMGTAMAQAGGAAAAAAQMQQGYTYAVEQLSGAWETLQIVVGSLVLPALTNLVGALATGIGGITAFVQSIAGADDPLVALGQAIGLTQQHAQAFASGVQQLGQTVAMIVNEMIGWWQQHGAQVIAAVQPLWQEVVATAQAFGALLQQAVTSLLGAIASVWQAHGQTIITAAQTAWTIISGVVQAALQVIRGIVNAVTAALKGDWSGALSALQGATSQAWQTITVMWRQAGPTLAAATSAIGNAITQAWNGLVRSAAEMGAELIDGIRSGVTRAAQSLARAVADAAWQALQAAKSALGISSPSRIAAEQVGKPIAQGIAGGLQANVGMVAQAGRAVAQASLAEPRQVSTTVTVGGITVQPSAGMNEQALAQRIRAELETLIRTARAGG